MKTLTQYISEKASKTVVISFGRLNPPTQGHEKLANKLKSEAASRNADAKLYLSHSTNPKKDPLSFADKVKFAKKAFGPMVQNSAARTIIEVAKELTGKYSNLVVVVGSDRVPEFKTLLDKYNGKDFTFDSIEIVSAGERDPDAEGVEGMSGSKMRKFAADEDLANFKKGVPSKLSDSDAEELYNAVRKGMKLDEEFSKFVEEEVQASADYKVSKSGRKYPARRIVLGKKKLDDEDNGDEKEDKEDVKEAVLGYSARIGRRTRFKTMQKKIQRARMLAMRRYATPERLKNRSLKMSRSFFRRLLAGGKDYSQLSTGAKIAIDTRLQKFNPSIKKFAARMLPKVRSRETLRHTASQKTEDINLMFSSLVAEATDKKQVSRVDQLVRYGLADKSMLSLIKRTMEKLQSGDPLNPSERKATENLLTTLIDMVTSSDALFRLTKSQLQKESYDILEQADEEENDEIEVDGLHMARLEIAALIDDAEDLFEMLNEMEEEPDAWIQSKISLAVDYIAVVKDYIEFNSSEEDEEDEEDEGEDDEDYNDYEKEVDEVVKGMNPEEYEEYEEEFKKIFETLDTLKKKAEKTNIDFSIMREVYQRGMAAWNDATTNLTQEQYAFARVNSFISGGATTKQDDADLWESVQRNKKFSQFAEGVLEYGTDAARMAYARSTPGQSQEITMARYSANTALDAINSANVQRLYKLYSEDIAKEVERCLTENVDLVDNNYRLGSEKFFEFFRAVRESGIELTGMNKRLIEETDIGEIVEYEGTYVPLDCPMIEEEEDKDVEIGKPKRGGPKKFYVYVRKPDGGVKKVTWGDTTGLSVKLNDPEARKSFAARHQCSMQKDRTSAAYWACNTPRYAKQLGLSGGGNFYW